MSSMFETEKHHFMYFYSCIFYKTKELKNLHYIKLELKLLFMNTVTV